MMLFKSTTSMKSANCLALSVLLLLVAGCANPELVQESLVPEHTVQVSGLVVEVVFRPLLDRRSRIAVLSRRLRHTSASATVGD